MEANFIIRFSPEAKIDYQYNLIVVTEREQFEVPIYAIGKRAMIDFPDMLDFGNCPVKYATEKPVIIRNLGEKTTKWFLKMPNGFDIDRKEGVLEQGNNEQIVIKYQPRPASACFHVQRVPPSLQCAAAPGRPAPPRNALRAPCGSTCANCLSGSCSGFTRRRRSRTRARPC